MEPTSAKTLTLLSRTGLRQRLLVRTVAGPRIGFGHLRRSLILAGKLRRYVRPLFLLDRDDIWSREQVAEGEFDSRVFDPRKPWQDLDAVAGVLVDTRQRAGLRGLVREARARKVPVVSIHDLGLAPVASDVAIDGSIASEANRLHLHAVSCLTGPDYFVLGERYAKLHGRSKAIRRRIQKVVINLGGGNGGKYFVPILTGLRSTGRPLEVIGFPGFCSWGQEKMASASWEPLHFRWIAREEDAAGLVFDADLVISAGGCAAYEALCMGGPLCALSYDRHQSATVAALINAGACLDLGPGDRLCCEAVRRGFAELDLDPGLRRRMSARGRRLVDGAGARRVAGIIRKTLNGNTAMATPDRWRTEHGRIHLARGDGWNRKPSTRSHLAP